MESERTYFEKGEFVEIRVYEVERGKFFPEGIKYSMNFIKNGLCILRYDNERGKGHHKHLKGKEVKLEFKDVNNLKRAFMEEVSAIRSVDLHESKKRNHHG